MNIGLASPLKIQKRRRVFFSFHYQEDIWRANQIRNSWMYLSDQNREGVGFFDGSIWESKRRESDVSLKNLIREGVENTSVTCVLAGTFTYLRRWVRYEICRSVLKANGIITVNVNRMLDSRGNTTVKGPNPLDYIGVYLSSDNLTYFAELEGSKWVRYKDYSGAVNLTSSWANPTSNHVIPISKFSTEYCYIGHGGSRSFATWVDSAAAQVGR